MNTAITPAVSMPGSLRRRPRVCATMVAGWLLGCVLGLWLVNRHAFTAVPVAGTVDAWPAASTIARDPRRPTLVMFAHPLCPCTRASLVELAEVVAATAGKPQVQILFFDAARPAERLQDAEAWRAATAIPGVELHRDVSALEARRFGARASGHCFLFDATGRLLFSGGITPSRGHAGENSGREALIGWLNDGHAPQAGAPVFGCAIFADVAATAP